MKPNHKRFKDTDEEEDDDDYEESNSEELAGFGKHLPSGSAKTNYHLESDDEDSIYPVYSDTGSELAASDIEGQEKGEDFPDVRAWGKDKRHYYSTDYVDPDYGGYQEKDAILADLEEEEAKNLQKYLVEQLDEDDFSLEALAKKVTEEESQQIDQVVKVDVSKLSKKQKITLLLKESPEFFGLVEDFKKKMTVAKDFLLPVMKLQKENKIHMFQGMAFVRTLYQIVLNYCTNICAYLLLKASNVNMQIHPIIRRLYQYRHLLSRLSPTFEETIKPQISILLKNLENTDDTDELQKKKLSTILKKSLPDKNSDKHEDIDKLKGPIPATIDTDENFTEEEPEDEPNLNKKDSPDNENPAPVDSRRAITYQIEKNKGLTPHRNKLQRNPRVKHRNQYRKAKIRRKGAVREVRRELARYDGEMSGIKVSVTKSIKIRS